MAAAPGHARISGCLADGKAGGGACCDGLLIVDRAENLRAVDQREARYRRFAVAAHELEMAATLPESCPVYVYQADADVPPHPEAPKILQSYLDAVLQGFFAVHGEAGVRRFIAETHGFEMPLHGDRLTPAYPRSVTLTDGERELFDALLSKEALKPESAQPLRHRL